MKMAPELEVNMAFKRLRDLAFVLFMGLLCAGGASGVEPEAVKKGERYYLSIPLGYWVYRGEAKRCGLPSDRMRCDGSEETTICWYAQNACERAYLTDSAMVEKAAFSPGEPSCSGFTLAGEWPAVLFTSPEECRKAAVTPVDFEIEKAYGYYGSKLIVKRKSR
jgi:hypothetical protein